MSVIDGCGASAASLRSERATGVAHSGDPCGGGRDGTCTE